VTSQNLTVTDFGEGGRIGSAPAGLVPAEYGLGTTGLERNPHWPHRACRGGKRFGNYKRRRYEDAPLRRHVVREATGLAAEVILRARQTFAPPGQARRGREVEAVRE
jgi:hypothetical protein